MVKIKGNGFTLRPWKKSDEKSLVENANSKKVWVNLLDIFPYPYTKKDADLWIKESSKDPMKFNFAIVIDDKAVGSIGINRKKDVFRFSASMGYWLGEEYWGKGIATQAVKLVTNYATKKWKLKRIEAMAFAWNPASCRVLEKAGFKYEGTLKKSVFKNGKFVDELVFAKVK